MPYAMPTEIIIRRATREDLPTLGRLGALLVRTHHAFDPKRFIDAPPHTEIGYASYLGEQLTAPDVAVFVAVQGTQVVGYAYAGLEGRDYMALRGPAGALYDIVVDPIYRRGGVSQMLLLALLAVLPIYHAPCPVVIVRAHAGD